MGIFNFIQLKDMKLIYFGAHGRGCPIRALLTHAKVEFEDRVLPAGEVNADGVFEEGRDDWWEWKKDQALLNEKIGEDVEFKALPLLKLDDGTRPSHGCYYDLPLSQIWV